MDALSTSQNFCTLPWLHQLGREGRHGARLACQSVQRGEPATRWTATQPGSPGSRGNVASEPLRLREGQEDRGRASVWDSNGERWRRPRGSADPRRTQKRPLYRGREARSDGRETEKGMGGRAPGWGQGDTEDEDAYRGPERHEPGVGSRVIELWEAIAGEVCQTA